MCWRGALARPPARRARLGGRGGGEGVALAFVRPPGGCWAAADGGGDAAEGGGGGDAAEGGGGGGDAAEGSGGGGTGARRR